MEMLYKYLTVKYPELSPGAEWSMMLYALVIDWIVGLISYRFIERPLSERAERLTEKMK